MSEPLTRADLEAALERMEQRLSERLEQRLSERLEARIDMRSAALGESITAQLERLETRLTTAFWKWARPREIRERLLYKRLEVSDNALSGFRTELSGLEERVALLEQRLNDEQLPQPPQ